MDKIPRHRNGFPDEIWRQSSTKTFPLSTEALLVVSRDYATRRLASGAFNFSRCTTTAGPLDQASPGARQGAPLPPITDACQTSAQR